MPAVVYTTPATETHCQSQGGIQIGRLTELLSQGERNLGFFDCRACYHEFRAADLLGAVDDALEIVWMALLPTVLATEYGICEVDAYL